MKMRADRRAVDKIFRRRDRYEIPDWQREKVWDIQKKQRLIDSMLRGWKLPKFYFVKTSEDEFEVVDGQQRLSAIFEFCANELELSPESAKHFRGAKYENLPTRVADEFDDFEIEYDAIEDASEEDLKEFFQRLQGGMPLTSSEKLNSVHSKLRDFCRSVSKHAFFAEDIGVANTRYAHFDIASKVVAVEIEGLDTGLRFDDLKTIFESNRSFSPNSAAGKRVRAAPLSWAPAFCAHEATNHAAGECGAGHEMGFVVHGLWPEPERGGLLENCTTVRPASPDIEQHMLPLMPDAGLIQHEWHTHGSCSELTAEEYFAIVKRAAEKVRIPELYRSLHRALTTNPGEIERRFAAVNHLRGISAVRVQCRAGEVRELLICLTKDLQPRPCSRNVRDCRAGELFMRPLR